MTDTTIGIDYAALASKAAALRKMQDQFEEEIRGHITRLQGFLAGGNTKTPRKRAARKPAGAAK